MGRRPGQMYLVIDENTLFAEPSHKTRRFFSESDRLHVLALYGDDAQVEILKAIETELCIQNNTHRDMYQLRTIMWQQTLVGIVSVPFYDEEQLRCLVIAHDYRVRDGRSYSTQNARGKSVDFPFHGPSFRILVPITTRI